MDSRSDSEDNKIFKKMMLEEIKSFETILKQSIQKSRHLEVVVCSKEQCADLLTKSSELQEICDQATDTTDSLKSDVQTLRLSMYEAMAMSAEAQSKVEMINNPTYAVPFNSIYNLKNDSKLTASFNFSHNSLEDSAISTSQTNKRQLTKLQNQVAQFEARFDMCNKQIDANWSIHQDNVKENNR